MAETFDIAIVGAGITGCAIARQLARYDLSICVIEAANDIALGASKANGGLVHAGYDPAPGTVKAQVNARGCELYGTWAQELGFLFRRTGSMVLGFNDEDRAHLEQPRSNGLANGVPELSIVEPDRIHELEPRVSADATCALWCPSTGFVDPFEVAIAALENAVANGVTFMRSASVEAIEVASSGDDARFTLATPAGNVRCRYLINAAGNGAADISHMAGAEEFQMVWRQGNIVVLDKEPRTLMPLYPVPTPISKGVIVTGTVHGNTVITATYCSDMTRTFFWGEPDEETARIYDIVRRANEAAEALIAPGVRMCDLDRAARDVIEDAGYGQYFTHRLGHSIGLQDHEPGDVSLVNEQVVEPGMTFSIEPGIYLPGHTGVRIEDLALVTESGVEILNAHPHDPVRLD